MSKCALCPNDIDPLDLDVSQETLVWQGGGPMEYREYTGRVAHRDCVAQLTEKHVTGQEPLF